MRRRGKPAVHHRLNYSSEWVASDGETECKTKREVEKVERER